MEATLVPVALFVSIAYAVVGAFRAVTESRTRRKLVEAGASVEMVRAVVGEAPGRRDAAPPALTWGLLVASVGVALVALRFIPHRDDDPAVIGVVLLAAAAGLLGSYALGRRMARRDVSRPDEARALPPAPPGAGPGGPPSVPPVAHLELGGPA